MPDFYHPSRGIAAPLAQSPQEACPCLVSWAFGGPETATHPTDTLPEGAVATAWMLTRVPAGIDAMTFVRVVDVDGEEQVELWGFRYRKVP